MIKQDDNLLNIIITGYYFQKNLGDEMFLDIAKTLFTNNIFKNRINRIEYFKIEDINRRDVMVKCDKLILFGGEVFNDYFLDRILEFKKNRPLVELYAIGISCNQDYATIHNKVNVFDKIVFRSKIDYEYFHRTFKKDCLFAPDIIFLNKNKYFNIFNKKKNIGLFVAQPLYINLVNTEKDRYIRNIRNIIDYWLTKEYTIYFFPMCYNLKNSEDDNILINKITESYTITEKKNFKYFMTNKKILDYLPLMKYNFCWRFHSVVLSIIYNTPFIAFSDTPKIKNILLDNNLTELSFTMDKWIDACDYVINNKINLKKRLSKIYNDNNKLAHSIYENKNIYNEKRLTPPFYINNNDCTNIINYVKQIYNKHKSNIDDDYNTELILFILTKTLNTPYNYGLRNKIYLGIDKLNNDLLWLINDFIIKNNIFFYSFIASILNKPQINNKSRLSLNIHYINQFDMEGLHRSGWSYVLHSLKYRHNSESIMCDFYLDRTFHWNNTIYSQLKIIPYLQPWIGFIHHTTETAYSDYNTINLFKNKNFIKSLDNCKGLIVLSNQLKTEVERLLEKNYKDIKVYNLVHPTEFVSEIYMFNMNNFKNNKDKKIIQIGAWMRDISAIFKIELDQDLYISKYALVGKKMENYYNIVEGYNNDLPKQVIIPSISRDRKRRKTYINTSVNIISYLENNDYDILLSQNIVFIKLIDASAVNTLIECIVRNTPIVINKLPAIVELLGNNYPLYYEDIDYVKSLITMKTIENAYFHLKNLDKNKFKIDYFINKFDLILRDIL